jgi:DNA-binding transcriptional LysR family regulator
MRITLRQLQIFVAIAQSGSTTAAGEHISLSQSATSAAIAELERTINLRLFDRIGKRLQLNDHGRAMLPQAMAILNGAESLEKSYLNSASSQIILGASPTIGNYLLPRLLADYWRSQGIALDGATPPLQVIVANTAEIAAKVAEFEVDIGLIEGPCHRPDIQVTPWQQDELLLVAAPGHAVFRGDTQKDIPPERLANSNWLLRERGSGTREALEHIMLPHLSRLKSCLEFNSHEAIKQAAAQGLGIACLSPLVVADMLQSGRLVKLRTAFGSFRRRFNLLVHHQKQITPGMQSFINFASSSMEISYLQDMPNDGAPQTDNKKPATVRAV